MPQQYSGQYTLLPLICLNSNALPVSRHSHVLSLIAVYHLRYCTLLPLNLKSRTHGPNIRGTSTGSIKNRLTFDSCVQQPGQLLWNGHDRKMSADWYPISTLSHWQWFHCCREICTIKPAVEESSCFCFIRPADLWFLNLVYPAAFWSFFQPLSDYQSSEGAALNWENKALFLLPRYQPPHRDTVRDKAW